MIVNIKQGQLKGRKDASITNGKVFHSFLGIPYAEPPVGELRFQPPVSPKGWEGVRDATYDRNRCIQLLVPEPEIRASNESEDCLYLNVFTPGPPNAKAPPKPVMVYIHGGGFHTGAGDTSIVSPDHLAGYDVVLVTFNYRLHIFGYLNLNTPSSTGNCGCKDQVMALRWIKENVRAFGGDPENITLCGISAGAISLHLLTMSPLAKGLYHKVISESGTMIGTRVAEDQVDAGFEIGRKLGFTGTDPEELVKFLRMQSAETLTKEAMSLVVAKKARMPCSMTGFKVFIPSIERSARDSFLPDYPINLIATSQPVPMIAGVAEQEGVVTIFGLEDHETFYAHLKQNLSDLVKSNVPCDPSKVDEITKRLKKHYLDPLGDDVTDEVLREKFAEIYSHLNFVNMYDIVEKTVKKSAPLYMYQFGYVGQLNESQFWSMNLRGALHCDEAGYIYLSKGFYPNGVSINDADRTVIRNLCTAWTNFARTSNPNPMADGSVRWDIYTRDKPSFMLFRENCTSIEGKIWNEGLEFWQEIFHTYVDWNDSKNRLLQL